MRRPIEGNRKDGGGRSRLIPEGCSASIVAGLEASGLQRKEFAAGERKTGAISRNLQGNNARVNLRRFQLGLACYHPF